MKLIKTLLLTSVLLFSLWLGWSGGAVEPILNQAAGASAASVIIEQAISSFLRIGLQVVAPFIFALQLYAHLLGKEGKSQGKQEKPS